MLPLLVIFIWFAQAIYYGITGELVYGVFAVTIGSVATLLMITERDEEEEESYE